MSHGLCTLSHVSYATQPRYCRNYALKIYDARRNRRNAPSVARFSLPCHPWQGISVYRVHNSTVSRQLRYSLTRESVPSRSHGIKPLTLWQKRKNVMTKHHLYATINSKHYISVNTTPQHIFPVCITLKRADHFALFYKGHGSFQCFIYQSTAGKLKCRM